MHNMVVVTNRVGKVVQELYGVLKLVIMRVPTFEVEGRAKKRSSKSEAILR